MIPYCSRVRVNFILKQKCIQLKLKNFKHSLQQYILTSVHWHWHSVSTLTVLTQYGYGPYSNIIYHGHYHSKRHSLKHGNFDWESCFFTLWYFFRSEKSAKIHNSIWKNFIFVWKVLLCIYKRLLPQNWPCCNLSQCTILPFLWGLFKLTF